MNIISSFVLRIIKACIKALFFQAYNQLVSHYHCQSAPGRAGSVKSIRILHSACSENSRHLYELPELLVFFVVPFRNHYILCKGKELKHAELTPRQSGGEEGRSALSASLQRPYISDCLLLLCSVFNCFTLSLDSL